MIGLARELAEAKSRQDVTAALALCHPEMTLQAPAFGTTAHGHAANERALTSFFRTFPDYAVEPAGDVGHHGTLACWGTARMTLTGARFGEAPNGLRAELPVFLHFTFRDGLIASERFFFDLSELCAQSGISTDKARHALFGGSAELGAVGSGR
ncbi:hypothetical protein DY218_07955 [Streptomyces triticagri]|uniref:SnoaL-like domain-containing protein n=2 Tax=Streptomyces triticagri TaxID=2293568 RepID=A0A372M8S7_9ACTN|nr:hypothetical protein DY218_07955 [Streptomyces triticagri]